MRRLLLAALMVLPTFAAASWTLLPAARAAVAVLTFAPPSMSDADWQDPERLVDLRRSTQKHFLHHGVYIPLDDIVAPLPEAEASPTSAALVMQKACGRGRLYVWIPFKFRLPIQGERVLEWCWKQGA